MLEQDVVAHGVDKCTEAIGLAELSIPQCREYASKRLLSDVFNRLWRIEAGTQLQLDQFAEIGDEMFLRAEVSGLEAFDVGPIK